MYISNPLIMRNYLIFVLLFFVACNQNAQENKNKQNNEIKIAKKPELTELIAIPDEINSFKIDSVSFK